MPIPGRGGQGFSEAVARPEGFRPGLIQRTPVLLKQGLHGASGWGQECAEIGKETVAHPSPPERYQEPRSLFKGRFK